MKLTAQEVQEIFGTATAKPNADAHELLHLLAASLPKLWMHCLAEGPVKADQRRKFLELLDWFARRHTATVKRRHPANYRTRDGQVIRGSVDAVIIPKAGGCGVAVELDFAADINSAYKLLDLRRQYGHGCLLVSVYGSSVDEVRRRIDQGFKKPTQAWLALCQLPPYRG